uniref:Immunoglobulin domain-containing protein n=1 Tax=Astyanax mexicanus TaxID=7994 RepID=W5K4F0_ASTMX
MRKKSLDNLTLTLHSSVSTVSVLICLCHGWDVLVPKSVTAVEGSCVTLPCSTSPHSDVVWYLYRKASSPIVYSRKTEDIRDDFRGRTSAPGSSSEGDCSLTIDRVRPDENDESLYELAKVRAHLPLKGNNDCHAGLYFLTVKPEKPHISMENQQMEGKLFSANCSIRHSCPSSPPPVEWIGLSNVSNSVTTTKDQGGLWTSVFQAKFKPNLQDHEKNLSSKRTLRLVSILPENILMIPKTFRKVLCGLTRQTLNFLDCVFNYILYKSNTAFQKKNIIAIVKHGGGSVMTVWSCFAAS